MDEAAAAAGDAGDERTPRRGHGAAEDAGDGKKPSHFGRFNVTVGNGAGAFRRRCVQAR